MEDQNLPIDSLIVTQECVRKADQIDPMILFVKGGGVFDLESLAKYAKYNNLRVSPLIHIARFPDGLLYIHDGHHRILSIWKAERQVLFSTEYYIKDWTYADFEEINIGNGWFTPYDPRKEVRTPDFARYKDSIRKMIESQQQVNIEQIILDRKNEYAKQRRVWRIHEMQNPNFCLI